MSKYTRKIKIEYADGPAIRANVTDAVTGETINGIQKLRLTLDALDGLIPRAELHVLEPALSIEVEADVYGSPVRWILDGDQAKQFIADIRNIIAVVDRSEYPGINPHIERILQIVRFLDG